MNWRFALPLKFRERCGRPHKDEEAPIFKLSDLGIVGDVHKVVPQIIEAVKAKKG